VSSVTRVARQSDEAGSVAVAASRFAATSSSRHDGHNRPRLVRVSRASLRPHRPQASAAVAISASSLTSAIRHEPVAILVGMEEPNAQERLKLRGVLQDVLLVGREERATALLVRAVKVTRVALRFFPDEPGRSHDPLLVLKAQRRG